MTQYKIKFEKNNITSYVLVNAETMSDAKAIFINRYDTTIIDIEIQRPSEMIDQILGKNLR